MGAEIIEKHIIPNYNKNWIDASSSLDVRDFGQMINKIKSIHMAYGSSQRKVFNCEKKWKIKAHKSLYSKNFIRKGSIIKSSDIIIRRPRGKTNPIDFYKLINKKVLKNIKQNTNLTLKLVKKK